MAQIKSHQQPIHWADGGGINGSEKLDAYGHMGKSTKTAKEFNEAATDPRISSNNNNDGAPAIIQGHRGYGAA
jgi:hypothetical protein